MLPTRIISGGQTGVDRAALDVALALQIPCGGWCPRGRRAEDGRIPDCYPLKETASGDYAARTEANVRDSDGTLLIHLGAIEGGTAFTKRCAEQSGRPCFAIDLRSESAIVDTSTWLEANDVPDLNVAGPRASKEPTIYDATYTFLYRLFTTT
jgi:hypothetical protein